ncbi:hypothetical protein [Catenovulum maritimum]|uniref:Pullulanase n=1 Tax=Catenovulum maritimum TaxID=1513271 RepID=A0A0J8GU81_9ALTE|nr:hypothetical protein [Catenovulum maritimum]KMT66320.1 hypothetical protein XM47_04245 [Catenovulum maritimum]
MKNSALLILFLMLNVLSACSVTPYKKDIKETDRSEFLYLRGSFTWWDVEAHAKVEKVSGQLYKARVELIADSKPYEFKFADENWSLGSNCGYYALSDKTADLSNTVNANCKAKFEPFEFTPPETGDYDFFIDFTNEKFPKVWVRAAQAESLLDQIVPDL